MPPSWSRFGQKHAHQSPPGAHFIGSFSSLKGADTSAADRLLSFYSSVQLLASPHALETVLGDTTNTDLEELDYLCNLNGLQVLLHVTSSEKDPKTSQEQ